MTNKKITDLVELTTPTTDDVFPLVDIATNSTKKAQLANLPISTATQTALDAKQATLVSGTNIKTINSTSLLGSGDIAIAANPAGTAGQIQFSDGSAFAADSNLYWDNTNKRLGVGTSTPTNPLTITQGGNSVNFGADGAGVFIRPSGNMSLYSANSSVFQFITNSGIGINVNPTARLQVKGSGSTQATTSLLVQNSAGTAALTIKDDGGFFVGNGTSYTTTATIASTSTTNTYIEISSGGASFNSSLAFSKNGALSTLWQFYTDSSNNIAIFRNGVNREIWKIFESTKNVGIDETASSASFLDIASAKLFVNSTTKGFLPPRMTTTQKNAISTPAAGLVVYDSTTNKLCCYNGSTWNDLF